MDKKGRISFITVILIAFSCVVVFNIFYYKDNYRKPVEQYKTTAEKDIYVRFVMEAYDKIAENYWMKSGNYKAHNAPELPELFQLSLKKAANLTQIPTANDRTSTAEMLSTVFATATSSEMKKQLALQTLTVVTYNLLPVQRNGFMSEEKRVAFRQGVSNIDPSKDLYKDLGVEKGASSQEIEEAYTEKEKILKNATTTEAKAELKQIAYAKKVLTNENDKTLYDQAKIEPTVSKHVLGNTLYFYFKQISPTSLQEFGLAIENASTTHGLNSLIIDLRGNIGGDLNFASAFPGLFIGINQYTFDVFSKDEYKPQRTLLPKFAELKRYKEIAILTDSGTQSTAELTTAVLKRLNLARVVGVTTRGWGTIENTYPIETVIDPTQQYFLYLVNNITLGDDNQPIEGKGVSPDVDITKKDWKNQLKNYFNSESLIKVLRERVTQPPLPID